MKQSVFEALIDGFSKHIHPQDVNWTSDMKAEVRHIPSWWRRVFFMLGCVRLCAALALRHRVGVRRLGQGLIAAGIFMFCIGGAIMTRDHLSADVIKPVNLLLLAYALAGILALITLDVMKRYVLSAAFIFGAFAVLLFWPNLISQQNYLQALTMEAALFMTALYIAASFVNWAEGGHHA